MAEVQLTVAGRSYRLACRDEDEAALRLAARSVDQRASELAEQLGAVGESRLLLMTALSFAGEPAAESVAAPEPMASDWMRSLAGRLELVAQHLERAAGAH